MTPVSAIAAISPTVFHQLPEAIVMVSAARSFWSGPKFLFSFGWTARSEYGMPPT